MTTPGVPHCTYCMNTQTQSYLMFVKPNECPTCKAYYAGFEAARTMNL